MLAVLAATLLSHADLVGTTAAPDPLGRGAWFVDPTEDAVLLVTPGAGVERFDGCLWPSRLVVDSSGAAYVTCRQSGEVRRLVSGQPATVWQVGAEPSALALDDDHRRLYVGLTTANEVVMLDADTGRALATAEVGTEPTGVALFRASLVVSSRKSDLLQLHPRTLDAPPQTRRLQVPRLDPTVETLVTGDVLVPESSRLIIVAPVAETGSIIQDTYYQGTRGSPVTQELFTLSPTLELQRVRNVVLPDVAAAYWSERDRVLMMASRGLGGVVSVPLDRRIIGLAWDLPAGVIGVTDDGHRTFALNDVTRELSLREKTRVGRIALGGGGDPELARGRALFHQANSIRISGAALACASCHRDGRDDGRTWLGQSAMRQTPMLAGRAIAQTAPYGWNGAYETLEGYIAFTIRERMLGDGLSSKDLAALARYLREGLRPVTKPAVASSQPGDPRRGRIVFHAGAAACSTCHGAMDGFTDGEAHDVGSLARPERAAWHIQNDGLLLRAIAPFRPGPPKPPSGLDQLSDFIAVQANAKLGIKPPPPALAPATPPIPSRLYRFDTPSLLQLALTAPYLHDGSAKTLDEVFERLGDHMGTVSSLTPRERGDLVAYLQTL